MPRNRRCRFLLRFQICCSRAFPFLSDGRYDTHPAAGSFSILLRSFSQDCCRSGNKRGCFLVCSYCQFKRSRSFFRRNRYSIYAPGAGKVCGGAGFNFFLQKVHDSYQSASTGARFSGAVHYICCLPRHGRRLCLI